MKEQYTKPKMRPENFSAALQDFEDARGELFDAFYQEFAPRLTRICIKITNALEYLKGKMEAK